ncbi:putative Chromosome partition protein Smc [Tenacibaculum sp. 190130A14a]|uniref:Uncharacterized protein n=1 Tax=Tenacibaculum polynesiense TaxID=3137857 RepID=A0ABM9PAY9_9FLAO
MLKKVTLTIVLLFLFVGLNAQNSIDKKTKDDLTTITFTTSEGTVKLFLPKLFQNDVFSGTIEITPRGKKSKHKNKNRKLLEKYSFNIGNQQFSLANRIFSTEFSQENSVELIIKNAKNRILNKVSLEVFSNKYKPSAHNPEYIVTDYPSKINHGFDGTLSNTIASIAGKRLKVLAESTSQMFFKAPINFSGVKELTVSDAGEKIVTKVHVLDLELSAGKLHLKRGESTSLKVRVFGFKGLTTPIPLTITNLSPRSIRLGGGNNQEIIIHPAEYAEGSYSTAKSIRAISTGGFTISVYVKPPTTTHKVGEDALCDCELNNESFLLSTSACEELKTDTSPESEIDMEPEQIESSVVVEIPEKIGKENAPVNVKIGTEEDIAAVIVSHKHVLDKEWETIVKDSVGSDGYNLSWNPPLGNDGIHQFRTQVVNKNDKIHQQISYSEINVIPTEKLEAGLGEVSFSVSNADIQRKFRLANSYRNQKTGISTQVRRLRRQLKNKYKERNENRTLYKELVAIDEVLDKVPKVYKDSLNKLVDSLVKLKAFVPVKIDTAALNKSVKDAQAKHDACKERLKKLKNEQEQIEKERDDLKKKMDKALQELTDLHLDNDWIGKHGYHPDGRYWYGYVGDERANTNITPEARAIKNRLKKLKGPYNRSIKKLKKLPQKIVEAGEECDKLSKDLEKAKEAAKNGKQYVGTELEIEDKCRQIKSLLMQLKKWCDDNGAKCTFRGKLNALINKCPKDPEGIAVFWKDFENLLQLKQQKEKGFKEKADQNQREIDRIRREKENAERRQKELEEKQRIATEEAEKLRERRKKEAEEARKREESSSTSSSGSGTRNPKPKEILKEPIEVPDKVLMFRAQSHVFRELYTDYYINKGPCHCITKAIAYGNNSYSMASKIIGGIGVGVAFAPLEAFPGTSLATRLGIGALKSIANAVFAGEKITDEIAKNLLDVMGGEIFPKLMGNQFAGNRMNDIAKKGLNAVLEAEGVRVIKKEGTVSTRKCGKVKGKSTMLFNPNTGWVSIMIKIENCPLLVIKYKVDKNGIPTTKPVVKQIR